MQHMPHSVSRAMLPRRHGGDAGLPPPRLVARGGPTMLCAMRMPSSTPCSAAHVHRGTWWQLNCVRCNAQTQAPPPHLDAQDAFRLLRCLLSSRPSYVLSVIFVSVPLAPDDPTLAAHRAAANANNAAPAYADLQGECCTAPQHACAAPRAPAPRRLWPVQLPGRPASRGLPCRLR